ncbi:hypothetical protein [Luteolibacter marinus]|uniref:hypothetical protein n=1 Tax=Luteolibacter marinus TaxID=2776705 RepID=UPI001868C255|nr:hypothetical protein [Luteolibacter marinus]
MKHLLVTLLAVFLFALLLWRPWESETHVSSAPTPPPAAAPPAAADAITAADVAPPVPAPTAIPTGLTGPEIQQVRDAIDNLEFVFRDFANALGGNPVGTNAEITAALQGDNAKQLQLDVPEGSTVNESGELCDPWGSPWFFHQLSGTRMEIRSAGKDRKLYTDDDFVR